MEILNKYHNLIVIKSISKSYGVPGLRLGVLASSNKDYLNVKLAEYRGYLMCLLDSKIFLADSRNMFEKTTNKAEYEWFYWELPFNINYITN